MPNPKQILKSLFLPIKSFAGIIFIVFYGAIFLIPIIVYTILGDNEDD